IHVRMSIPKIVRFYCPAYNAVAILRIPVEQQECLLCPAREPGAWRAYETQKSVDFRLRFAWIGSRYGTGHRAATERQQRAWFSAADARKGSNSYRHTWSDCGRSQMEAGLAGTG